MKKSSPRLVDLVRGYYASPEFRALSYSTRYVRRLQLDRILREPIGPENPSLIETLPAELTPKVIRKLRDRRAAKVESANGLLKSLRAVYKWGTEQELVNINAARDVPYIKHKTAGFHTWAADEVATYEKHWPLGTHQRVALAVLLYTGLRRSDAVRVGYHMVKDDWLRVQTIKTGSVVELPVLEDLKTVLAAGPLGKETWIAGLRGNPIQADSFGNMFREWCNSAGLTHCTAHGLRKAGACQAAERGATEQQLMAIFGWVTSQEAILYTRAANRRKMSGEAGRFLGRKEVAPSPPENDL
jgi:integrase